MEITFDQVKRDRTFAERGLAFEDAIQVFAGPNFRVSDDRQDYGEPRYLTFGLLRGPHGYAGLDAARQSPTSDLDEVRQ